MDWLALLRVCIAFGVLAVASWSDWKSRTASDSYWIIIGTAGLTFLCMQLLEDGVPPLFFLFPLSLGIIFYDLFWDRPGLLEKGSNDMAIVLYVVAFICLGTLLIIYWDSSYLWEMMVIIIVFLLIMVLYYLDVIKGGADAKALIALTVLFPSYPVFAGFPLISIPSDLAMLLFPFSILILFNAALLVMIFPISFMFYNLVRGDVKFPLMLFGYRMTIEEARRKFVWSMERVENGSIVSSLFPNGSEDEEKVMAHLEANGAEHVWVTPKIPFLIPITISLLFSALVGNLFFYFLS